MEGPWRSQVSRKDHRAHLTRTYKKLDDMIIIMIKGKMARLITSHSI